MDINTRMQHAYAQQQRSNTLAKMSKEDRQAWLDEANATLRLGRTNREAKGLMDMAGDRTLDITDGLRNKMMATAIAIFKQNAER